MLRRILRHLILLLVTIFLGGLLGATMVRFGPGFGTDEQVLNPQLRPETRQARAATHRQEQNIGHFYLSYLHGLLHGDLGISRKFERPVRELFAERIPVTAKSIAVGLLLAWSLSLALALPAVVLRSRSFELFATGLSGLLICIPSAVLALIFLIANRPAPIALGLVIFPKVYRFLRNLLEQNYEKPHVLTAQAKGLGSARILFWHILPGSLPQLAALAGISVSLAFAASIPIEVVADVPGVGQLAWYAALARDLPLLVNLTLLICVLTVAANGLSDLAIPEREAVTS